MNTFCSKYVLKWENSVNVSLGYFPMSIGPTALPVYDAIEYALSKTVPFSASLSRFGEMSLW